MMRWLSSLTLFLICLSLSSPAGQTTVKSEFVKLRTDDGITLSGALWTPVKGTPRVGVVLAHGSGGGSEFYGGWLTWLGEHFAEAGYLALSMNRRDHGPEEGLHTFEAAAMDHRYMVDLLASRGAQTIILAGHSYGTVTTPYYAVTSRDRRVKGLILYAPLGRNRERSRTPDAQAEYDARVEDARKMIAAGRGKESIHLPPLTPAGRPRYFTYEAFLSKMGPYTKEDPVGNIRQLGDQPILAIRDPADPLPGTLPPTQQRLQEASKSLEYILLPDTRNGQMNGAAHVFLGREAEVFQLTLQWLRKHKLGPDSGGEKP